MMWDFGGFGYERAVKSRNRGRSPNPPQLRIPSPAFPSPNVIESSISYSYTSSSYALTDNDYFQSYISGGATMSVTRTAPPPPLPRHPSPQNVVQVINHSKHHPSKPKPHHSRSQPHLRPPPIPFPSPNTPSTSYHSAPPIERFPSSGPSSPPDRKRVSSHRKPAVEVAPSGAVFYKAPTKKPYSSSRPDPINPNFQYSKCTGRRRALCVGINYRGQPNELRGCVNDANNVRRFLIDNGRYKSSEIMLLTDESRDPQKMPTRQNLIEAMRWLVRGAKANDALFFHYSGHGGQVPDKDGDEIDGWDEVIFPLDFKKSGPIVDDEMHDIMVKPLPRGCRLTGLFDACHSGTVLDLPYVYSAHGRLKGSQVTDRWLSRKTTPADVISLSGCGDDQTSADTFAGGVAVGAMSHAFIRALTDQPTQSYDGLLRSIRRILHPRFSQKPQLGSSHHIDTNLNFVY